MLGGGMTASDGEPQCSWSSARQAVMSVVQGQRRWCVNAPSRHSEHCSKSSWWWGDILVGSRGPMKGSR